MGFYEGFAEYWLDMLSRLMHPAGPGASVGKSKESRYVLAVRGSLHRLVERVMDDPPSPACWSGAGWVWTLCGICWSKKSSAEPCRAISQARQLIDMISSFPTINPSTSASTTSATPADPSGLPAPTEEDTADDPTDLPRLLSSIRAKYRLLCTSVGARPRLVAAAPAAASEMGAEGVDVGMDTGPGEGQNGSGQNQGQGQDYEQGGVVSGIEGPMKGVDTRQLRF